MTQALLISDLSFEARGCGGGVEVSVLAFYSVDPSSNPPGNLIFLYCTYKSRKGKKREAGVGPLKKLLGYWVPLH